jgi:hypothetical protein
MSADELKSRLAETEETLGAIQEYMVCLQEA